MKRQVKINQDIINQMLPDIPPEFEQEMRYMIASLPVKRKERVMRKKVSLGLVLVLIFMTLTVGATAAVLLGGKDFVDQIMAPRAKQTQDDRFTQQEVDEILRLARENEIELPDYAAKALSRQTDGEFKEELMRVFVKSEYGFYPAGWPIEVQAWYSEMLVDAGLADVASCVLPEGDEYTEEQILAIVRDEIFKLDPDAPIDDPAAYRRFTTYTETKVNPFYTERAWWVEYEAQDLYRTDYAFELDTKGNITHTRHIAGIMGASDAMRGQFFGDRFARLYGDGYGTVSWTSDILLLYQEAVRHRVETEGEDSVSFQEKTLLSQVFLPEDTAPVSKDQAILNARAALPGQDWSTSYVTTEIAVLLQGESGPVWEVSLRSASGWCHAEVDAQNGNVLSKEAEGIHRDWRSWVTNSYWLENKPEESNVSSFAPLPQATNRPDGKPWIWYNDAAPDYFWARLDEIGFDTATLIKQWTLEYGDDESWWPLEAQAIYFLRFHINTYLYDTNEISLAGFPDENDLTQDEATAIARAAIVEHSDGTVTEADLSDLLVKYEFWFNYFGRGSHSWSLIFTRLQGGDLYVVDLDAKTGEVKSVEYIETDARYFAPVPTLPPRADGMPALWYDEALGDADFWARLDELNITAANAEEMRESLTAQYGDYLYWPLEYQAALSIAKASSSRSGSVVLALPGPGDITVEQAKEAAWNAYVPLARENGHDDDWLSQVGVTIAFNHDEDGTHYFIQYVAPEFNADHSLDPALGGIVGYVAVDAKTGEVLYCDADENGNG